MPTDIQLSTEQLAAKELILDWLRSPGKQILRLGGFAGTGKTTLVKHILAESRVEHAVTSFTGKAVSVLRRKGTVYAQTLHSFLYEPHDNGDGTVTFTKRPRAELERFELVVNDESSMISSELHKDLLDTGAKILYVGDPGQLEPVGDNPNLMKDCDYVLKTIHRQAAESPILNFATAIRQGSPIGTQYTASNDHGEVLVCSKNTAIHEHVDEADQIICGLNATRTTLNAAIRLHKGFSGPLVEGEKLICLRNDKKAGLFNGMILYVTKIRAEWSDCWLCDLTDELDKRYSRIKVNRQCILEGEWKQSNGRVPFEHNLFAYGYVVTCHKAQGSEWDTVVVIDQANSRLWTPSKWRYTAITRAAKRLIYGI
jgi:exodeoxyribonuclease-5